MAGNSELKGIRFPDDVKEAVNKYGEWLQKEGFLPDSNFSQTVLFLLRRAMLKGDLKTPPAWFKKGP